MPKPEEDDLIEEVLFDEDELAGGGVGSSGHSKMGTEESMSTNGEDDAGSRRGSRLPR